MTDLLEDLESNLWLRIAAIMGASGLNVFVAIPAFEFFLAGEVVSGATVMASFVGSVLLATFPFIFFRDENGNAGWSQGSYESIFSTLLILAGLTMAMADVTASIIPEIVAIYSFSSMAIAAGITSYLLNKDSEPAKAKESKV